MGFHSYYYDKTTLDYSTTIRKAFDGVIQGFSFPTISLCSLQSEQISVSSINLALQQLDIIQPPVQEYLLNQ